MSSKAPFGEGGAQGGVAMVGDHGELLAGSEMIGCIQLVSPTFFPAEAWIPQRP
ncbi:MAG TPA: hypothetical protein VHG32_13440 [Thermoanaerobaculia bacterium]|jgi:hypothetical protein|nr:hypothetical protein [Thermoanaerobaculia bacterium]